jgi:hypothetical protein
MPLGSGIFLAASGIDIATILENGYTIVPE